MIAFKKRLFLMIVWGSHIMIAQDIDKELRTEFITVSDQGTINIPAGTIAISRTLWLDGKNGVTIMGAGMDKTILTFKDQVDGAEGIKITDSHNITIKGLTVQDTHGDGIKIQNTDGISLINTKAEWSGKPSKKNGAYGLYPVLCQNVLIDKCEAIGASDAGIYVGQSKNIIVRNSTAYHNVAGIEIENSLAADVYGNLSHHNTGGILIFDLPDLVQKKGGGIRIFDNVVKENNHDNFAPKGNIVGNVPPGTGIMILATNEVEVFRNEIVNNRTSGTAILSYFMTEEPIQDTAYYPYPTAIYIHNNSYERKSVKATMKTRFGKLMRLKLKFGRDVPHILYDGILDPETLDEAGNLLPEYRICISNNKNQSFVNIDAENDFKNISQELGAFDCQREPLAPAELSLSTP